MHINISTYIHEETLLLNSFIGYFREDRPNSHSTSGNEVRDGLFQARGKVIAEYRTRCMKHTVKEQFINLPVLEEIEYSIRVRT